MKVTHWAILGAVVGALALQISGLEHWQDATNPKWVGGTLMMLATTLGAVFTDKPRGTDTLSRATDQHQGDEIPKKG